jgi:hypothetical protein
MSKFIFMLFKPWLKSCRLRNGLLCVVSENCIVIRFWIRCSNSAMMGNDGTNRTPQYWSPNRHRTYPVFHYSKKGIRIVFFHKRSPLWSSGEGPWLRIQRSGFASRRYQSFWEVVVLEQGPLSLVSKIEEQLERKSSGFGLENWDYGRRRSAALTTRHPSIRKSCH